MPDCAAADRSGCPGHQLAAVRRLGGRGKAKLGISRSHNPNTSSSGGELKISIHSAESWAIPKCGTAIAAPINPAKKSTGTERLPATRQRANLSRW
jgi:hypothetical protein